jgi:hypothetical protein
MFSGGKMGVIVFRPAPSPPNPPNSFTVVGESSPLETLTAGLNTFTLATPIAVQGGDLLGNSQVNSNCDVLGSATDTILSDNGSEPAVGATVTPSRSDQGLLNTSATLTSAVPTTKQDCMDGGWQNFSGFKNQGDCVSFVATQGGNPPAGG